MNYDYVIHFHCSYVCYHETPYVVIERIQPNFLLVIKLF
jgi:hypothetical protein